MKIKWFGTASIAITSNEKSILFDPFIPLRGSHVPTNLEDYLPYSTILVTHGHLDHIVSIPTIVQKNKAKVYCTSAPYHTLLKKQVKIDNLVLIDDKSQFTIEGFHIRCLHSKHIHFDLKLICSLFLQKRFYQMIHNVAYLLMENIHCRQKGEILFYEIKVENKVIFLLGSLGLDKNIDYPTGCDCLILPYQGTSDLLTSALKIIDRLQPKMIFLDHHDDTFPPLTNRINTQPLFVAMKKKGIPVILPNYQDSTIL